MSQLLVRLNPEDRAEVLRGYRGSVMTDSPQAARNAADVAAALVRSDAPIPASPDSPPLTGPQYLVWSLNALLRKEPALGEPGQADGAIAPAGLAALRVEALHQAFTNGALSLNMVDELLDPLKPLLAMHDGWGEGDLAALDRGASDGFQALRKMEADLDDGRSLALLTIYSELGKAARADPAFAAFLRLVDDFGARAMPAYNREGGREPGAEKVVPNGPDFAREGSKATPALLARLRAADTADAVRGILAKQGWAESATPRAQLLAGAEGARNGMNDFLARALFAYAAEGRDLA